jgi:predicted nucleotide-binding protein
MCRQTLVQGKEDIADLLATLAVIQPYDPGDVIIQQDGTDTDIFFILSGSVTVSPNRRDDTVRPAGTHVGEMATIDPAARRSATVRANEPTVVARVTEANFSRVANSHPFIWRYLAREMSDRLRQRVAKVPPRRPNARVFIASSREALNIAESLETALTGDPVDVKIWTEGIFVAGLTNIEALEAELLRADFAVLLLSPDDEVISRGVTSQAPRDNLILDRFGTG